MAPEVWNGTVNERSDQYSLAITYAELRLGNPPFPGQSFAAVMMDHLQGTPNLTPLPEAESAVLRRALAKNPADRFGSCREFLQALQQAIKPEHVNAPVFPPSPVSRPWQRFLTMALASLLGLAVLLGLGFLVAKRLAEPVDRKGETEPEKTVLEPKKVMLDPREVGPDTTVRPILLPANLQRDFGLKVEMVGGRLSPSGTHLLAEGQEVAFRIEADRDVYVVIWTVAPDQTTVRQLFPNAEEPDYLIRAGTTRRFPGRDQDYVIEATPSQGMEWVWIRASNHKGDALDGPRDGPFAVFRTPKERKVMEEHVRGLEKRRRNAPKGQILVAEQILKYQVSPKN